MQAPNPPCPLGSELVAGVQAPPSATPCSLHWSHNFRQPAALQSMRRDQACRSTLRLWRRPRTAARCWRRCRTACGESMLARLFLQLYEVNTIPAAAAGCHNLDCAGNGKGAPVTSPFIPVVWPLWCQPLWIKLSSGALAAAQGVVHRVCNGCVAAAVACGHSRGRPLHTDVRALGSPLKGNGCAFGVLSCHHGMCKLFDQESMVPSRTKLHDHAKESSRLHGRCRQQRARS